MDAPDPQAWDDVALARRCARREEAAWRELLRRYGAVAEGAMRRVYLRAGQPNASRDAGDAMGSLAAALLERDGALLKAYRPEGSLKTYLAVVARSVAIKLLRKRHPTRSLDAAAEGGAPWLEFLAFNEAEDLPLEREQLLQALGQLEARDRLLLQLVYWEGLRYDEVAKVLGIPPGSLGPFLTRSREALRRILLAQIREG